jgi:pantoate--beta-alanine ligase
VKICKTKKELSAVLALAKTNKQSIGFVPTMGAIHIGHTSLISKAKSENDMVVCSIFVNPTQFNDPSDLLKYPRPIENDMQMLESVNCDVLFLPEISEMYSPGEIWDHTFGEIELCWEGASRPGHFKGVGQIVYKLLSLIQAHKAYFGQKDFQQTIVVKQLVKDFHLLTEIVVCPILRASDGLALSSRNIRLNELERVDATKIYKVLTDCKSQFLQQEAISTIQLTAENALKSIPNVQLEYFAIVAQDDLKTWDSTKLMAPIAIVALRFPSVRLIDNMVLE